MGQEHSSVRDCSNRNAASSCSQPFGQNCTTLLPARAASMRSDNIGTTAPASMSSASVTSCILPWKKFRLAVHKVNIYKAVVDRRNVSRSALSWQHGLLPGIQTAGLTAGVTMSLRTRSKKTAPFLTSWSTSAASVPKSQNENRKCTAARLPINTSGDIEFMGRVLSIILRNIAGSNVGTLDIKIRNVIQILTENFADNL